MGKNSRLAESPSSAIPKPLQVPDDKRSFGAGNEARTRDLNLGKVALYQLSYSRPKQTRNCRALPPGVKKNSARSEANALNYAVIPVASPPLPIICTRGGELKP